MDFIITHMKISELIKVLLMSLPCLTRSFTKKLPLNNPFTPFDSAQGDRQTERSPRLTGRAGKSDYIKMS